MKPPNAQAVAVKVHFEADGTPRLESFFWRQRWLTVLSHGRTWQAEDGRHLLVMTAGDQIFELVLRRSDLGWYIVRFPAAERLV